MSQSSLNPMEGRALSLARPCTQQFNDGQGRWLSPEVNEVWLGAGAPGGSGSTLQFTPTRGQTSRGQKWEPPLCSDDEDDELGETRPAKEQGHLQPMLDGCQSAAVLWLRCLHSSQPNPFRLALAREFRMHPTASLCAAAAVVQSSKADVQRCNFRYASFRPASVPPSLSVSKQPGHKQQQQQQQHNNTLSAKPASCNSDSVIESAGASWLLVPSCLLSSTCVLSELGIPEHPFAVLA